MNLSFIWAFARRIVYNKLRQITTWSGVMVWLTAKFGINMSDADLQMFAQGLMTLVGAILVFIDEYPVYNSKQLPSVADARAVAVDKQLQPDQRKNRD